MTKRDKAWEQFQESMWQDYSTGRGLASDPELEDAEHLSRGFLSHLKDHPHLLDDRLYLEYCLNRSRAL